MDKFTVWLNNSTCIYPMLKKKHYSKWPKNKNNQNVHQLINRQSVNNKILLKRNKLWIHVTTWICFYYAK